LGPYIFWLLESHQLHEPSTPVVTKPGKDDGGLAITAVFLKDGLIPWVMSIPNWEYTSGGCMAGIGTKRVGTVDTARGFVQETR
jgi:hypothetical protein